MASKSHGAQGDSNVIPFAPQHPKCKNCGANLPESERMCPSCAADNGFPNVRECEIPSHISVLRERFNRAKEDADERGLTKEFTEMRQHVLDYAGVVVSLPLTVALSLVSDPRQIYVNYETLVATGVRQPAVPEKDRMRCKVGGALFGSYANKIVYGALSLTSEGLASYGAVHLRLKLSAIKERTTLLESNSYKIYENHTDDLAEEVKGRHATWTHRDLLVMTKLANKLSKGQTRSQSQAILLYTDGRARHSDEFVEALIYGAFNIESVESLSTVALKHLDRNDTTMAKIILERFKTARQ